MFWLSKKLNQTTKQYYIIFQSKKEPARCDNSLKRKKIMPELKEESEGLTEEDDSVDSDEGQEEFLSL